MAASGPDRAGRCPELDPTARRLLEEMWSSGRRRSDQVTIAEARENLAAAIAAAPPGPRLERVEDRVTGAGVPVRIYADSPARLPILIFCHGGGWALGGINTADAACRELAGGGSAIVVSVEYRLAPEHPFPAGLEDLASVMVWASEEGSDLGGDPRRLVVAGESSGANLAAVSVNEAGPDAGVVGQVLICPFVRSGVDGELWDERFEDFFLSHREVQRFADSYGIGGLDRSDPRISPIEGPLPDPLVETLVITAECDPIGPHGRAYALKLRDGRRRVAHTEAKGMIHGFFSLPGLFPAAIDCASEIQSFVEALRPNPQNP